MASAADDAEKLWCEVERLEKELAACEEQIREKEKTLAKVRQSEAAAAAQAVLEELIKDVSNGDCLVRRIAGDALLLQQIATHLRKVLRAPVVLVADDGERLHLMALSPQNCKTALPANTVMAELTKMLGGKGGGRPDFAQGVAPRSGDVDAILHKMYEFIKQHLV